MIQLNDFKRQWAEIRAAVMGAVERVEASGWYILGQELEAFERQLSWRGRESRRSTRDKIALASFARAVVWSVKLLLAARRGLR